FAFDSRDTGSASDYLPHNYSANCVAYTGTHDNETLNGWFKSITKEEQQMARDYLGNYCTPASELYKSFINLIMKSAANVCIIPMQDYLGLDDSTRMNTPSTVGSNWKWRVKKSDISEQLGEEIRQIAITYGRINDSND
ncbi:MAG: 4-alpha-glucanotransferase, partial [Lachnospiraceae bacterium]|nr:4-alpha-glucanotransferase [Lachnospiraceae bacterium]